MAATRCPADRTSTSRDCARRRPVASVDRDSGCRLAPARRCPGRHRRRIAEGAVRSRRNGRKPALGPLDRGHRAPGRRPELRDAVDARPQAPARRRSCAPSGRATSRHSSVLMQGAGTRPLEALPRGRSTTRKATPITTWRGLTDVWLEVANDTLIEAHRTPEFLEAQRRLTRSSPTAACRNARSPKPGARCMHIPTRTEMDELQRDVYRAAPRAARAAAAGRHAALPKTLRQERPASRAAAERAP